MNINTPEAMKLRDQMRRLFENRIECIECGNSDWEQFLYVSFGPRPEDVVAGCKKCGNLGQRKDNQNEPREKS